MTTAQVSKTTVWDELRAAYNTEFAAEGTVSLEQLAKDYGVNYGTLRNRASQEKWKIDAQKLRDEVVAKTEAEVVPLLVKHRVEVIDSHLNKLGSIREKALDRLAKLVSTDKLTPDQTIKVVFDSLRAERMLNEMIGENMTHGMSEDEKEQALFQQFIKKFSADGADSIKNITPDTGPEAAPLLDAPSVTEPAVAESDVLEGTAVEVPDANG